ncbi:MAG: zinc ABC transporter substrate-binding protein [Rhodanobacteraceae bacterium]|nr:zinc ABC transporter substrate-binding protein [Rhodanobacteraceae bacterium]MBK7044406.1 zinc ABC transporter substrate-binding protein [Rhodanobacteraceae bacterium]MBP9155553.1 zinc ABC transporter substrate-binding protein [Xanthomonadales bacterium]HQW81502.1 zinc ABC transporter substrate-binding protein [Pseudomonadota bacterium]
MPIRSLLLLCLTATLSLPASAKIRVFVCEPEWGALVTELAGDSVDLDVATSALQDVHQIEAKPSLIAKLRRADLLVCSGGGLEAGWLPQLIRQAGNAKVASGNGAFMAVAQVNTLERPSQLDRAAGDLHPEGNPHIQMDPHRVLQVATALTTRLQQVDAANAAVYTQRLADFSSRWSAAILRWQDRAAPLRGRNIVVHHKSWVYLEEWLGLKEIGALEAKPGVPPTSAHLSGLVATTQSSDTLVIVRAAYQDAKASRWLSERTAVPAVSLPLTVGGDERATDLFGLFDSTIDLLLGAIK